MNLQNWLRAGWLIKHETSPQEIAELLAVADRDIKDASGPDLSPDAKHNIAYNAVLGCAAAALAASGYRPARGEHHYRLIHSLPLCLGKDLKTVTDRLEVARKKRNIGIYERAGAISAKEAGEIISLAIDMREMVKEWLAKNHPELF